MPVIISGSLCASSITDISGVGIGARPLGMGRAFVGLADDANAIFLNPAGIGTLRSINLISMRGDVAQDVSYTVLGGVFPMPLGSLGVGFINSSIPGIPLTSWVTSGGITTPSTYAYTDYSSRIMSLSYGVSAGELFKKAKLKDLYIGASLKYFYQGFSDPTSPSTSLEGASGSGIDLDLGFKVKANKWLDFGATLSNILPENFGGKFSWQRSGYSENIPSALKAGIAVKCLGKDGLRRLSSVEAVWLIDLEKEIDKSANPMFIHTGLEVTPNKYLSLRIGLDQQAGATTSGQGIETNLTYGISMKFSLFSFDYAYHKYGDIDQNATHYFSIGFIAPEPKPVPKPLNEIKLSPYAGQVYLDALDEESVSK